MPRVPAAETPLLAVPRSARRSQPRTGSALRSGNIALGPRRGLSALFGKGNPVRLGHGEAPVCSVSRVASLSGVARPGLSPALPASLTASLHRGRAVAGAVLPSCVEQRALSLPQQAGARERRREPPPSLIPLLLPLPRQAAAILGRERLRWLPLVSPCPGLSRVCPGFVRLLPGPGRGSGRGAGSAGGTGGSGGSRGRGPREGSPRSSARCLSPLLAFPSLRHFCGRRGALSSPLNRTAYSSQGRVPAFSGSYFVSQKGPN